MAADSAVHQFAKIWGRDVAYVLNVQQAQYKFTDRRDEALRQDAAVGQSQAAKPAESINPTEPFRPTVQKSEITRRRVEISPRPTNQKSKGMRV
jgi:hypothetical protein